MKSLLILALATVAALGQNEYQRRGLSLDRSPVKRQEAPVMTYPMRDIPANDPRFASVMESVQAALKAEEIAANRSRMITVLQTVAPGEFLVTTNRDNRMHMVAPGAAYADGSVIYGTLAPRGRLYSYTTVLGAPANADSFDFVPVEKIDLTPASLIAMLKTGLKIQIVKGTSILRCEKCNGWGKVADMAARRTSQDGKIECKPCDGKGKVTVPQPVSVQW